MDSVQTGYGRLSVEGRRVISFAASIGLAATLFIFGPAATAGAAPDGSPVNDPQASDNAAAEIVAAMRQQEALQPAVQALVAEGLNAPDSGFAGLAYEGEGLTLYWKGSLTPGISGALSVARAHGPIEVRAARFSKRELDAAADQIHKELGLRSDLQKIEVRHDGSGLTIEKLSAEEGTRVAAYAARRGQTTLSVDRWLATKRSPVPIAVKATGAPTELLACANNICRRTDDRSPWNGGTAYYNWDANVNPPWRCSTGFGVRRGTQTYILTADHCSTYPDVVADGALEVIGGVYSGRWEYDILLLNARGSRLIFDGTPTTSNTKIVNAWGYHVVNEYLCHSGVATGTRCGLKTVGGDYRLYGCDSDGDCFYRNGLIKSTQVDGLQAAQGGDSGGPVFSLSGSGVRAKGIVVGGSGTTMYFQDWADVIREFNAYPVT
jgi:streptogrisin D